MAFTESVIEQAALDWFQGSGYAYAFGPDIACDGPKPERTSYEEVILLGRLREAIARINSASLRLLGLCDTLLPKLMSGEVRVKA